MKKKINGDEEVVLFKIEAPNPRHTERKLVRYYASVKTFEQSWPLSVDQYPYWLVKRGETVPRNAALGYRLQNMRWVLIRKKYAPK